MTETTIPTVADYDAQIADLKRQRDLAALDNLKAVQTILNATATKKVADDIEALLPQLPADDGIGSARAQATNVVTILRQVAATFDREVSRVSATVQAA